jgi:SAM-dependent methyltransferase
METVIRKPFQGLLNILKFNWHFYALAAMVILFLFLLRNDLPFYIPVCLILLPVLALIVSLVASYFIYDVSDLYSLNWIEDYQIPKDAVIINVHAGFDETSALLKRKFPLASLRVFDFYDADKHTEVSIARARKAYPLFPGTESISSTKLPLEGRTVDLAFCIMSLHEIRNDGERIVFLNELTRALKPDGKIYVVEHLRDLNNFLAFTLGFFHFYSRQNWLQNFSDAGLSLKKEKKLTPFVSVFVLEKQLINA